MSREIVNFPTQNYQGALLSLPVAICNQSKQSPRVVRMSIKWADYGASDAKPNIGVRVNFANQQVNIPLESIRTIKIDNTGCDVPVFVQFLDTLDTIVCNKNSIVIAPVFTNQQELVIYGEGFFTGRTPTTMIEAANFDRQGLVIPGQDVASRVNSKFMGLDEAVGGALIFNTAAMPIVTPPGTDRIVCAAVVARSAGGGMNFVSASIGGVPATVAVNQLTIPTAGGGVVYRMLLLWARVPVGTTASLSVTFSTNYGYVSGAMWGLSNLTQLTPFDTDFDLGTIGTATRAAIVNAIPGAFGIFAQMEGTASPGVLGWSENVEISAVSVDTAQPYEASYGQVDFEKADNVPAYVFGNGIAGIVWI